MLGWLRKEHFTYIPIGTGIFQLKLTGEKGYATIESAAVALSTKFSSFFLWNLELDESSAREDWVSIKEKKSLFGIFFQKVRKIDFRYKNENLDTSRKRPVRRVSFEKLVDWYCL